MELFGIRFDRLITITNMPIKRFAHALARDGEHEAYMALLVNHFNPATVPELMCRSTLSVGWDGRVYDCDFNQMLEIPLGAERATVFDSGRPGSARRSTCVDRGTLFRLHRGQRLELRRRAHLRRTGRRNPGRLGRHPTPEARERVMMHETSTTETADATASQGGLPIAKILMGLAALVGLVLLGRAAGGYIPVFAEWVNGLGVWGPLVFIAGYAVAVVAFVPASLLTLAAGAIFGVAKGTAYVFVAATIGSSLAFLVSRYVARQAVERKLEGNTSFAAIDKAVGEQGRKIVFLLRMSPVFPFNLLNYALGLTRVSFTDYVTAAWACCRAPCSTSTRARPRATWPPSPAARDRRGTGGTALLVVGLIATVVVTTIVTRIARKALAEATGEES